MKKPTLISIILFGMVMNGMGQTTIPVKDKVLIERITFTKRAGVSYHHYDYRISPVIDGDYHVKAWANKYKGKWYSNYPFTIKILYNGHIINCYENGVFVFGFTSDGKYLWYNKEAFTHLILKNSKI